MTDTNDVPDLYFPDKYGFVSPQDKSLEDLICEVRNCLVSAGYKDSTLAVMDRVFKRLIKLADKLSVTQYTEKLRSQFLSDYYKTEDTEHETFCKSRYKLHRKVIFWIDSYLNEGKIDFTLIKKQACYLRTQVPEFVDAYLIFEKSLYGLSDSTKHSYRHIVGYFLDYLDIEKNYTSLSDIKKGDISAFIPKVVEEHYPNSLRGVLTGLRQFISSDEFGLTRFYPELPVKLRKKQKIIKPLSSEEINQVNNWMDSEECSVSFRNKAIVEIALGTGYRSVDIVGLKFSSFDWRNNRLIIVQKKTKKMLEYPLSASIGNAVVDYLMYERPQNDSEYIFLSENAPYIPLTSHCGIRAIIKNILEKANIILGSRPVGTILTRHSRATDLLNKGVPLALIAESMGHSDIHTVFVYLSTDQKRMIECILPLP